jgi:hypothetical protein
MKTAFKRAPFLLSWNLLSTFVTRPGAFAAGHLLKFFHSPVPGPGSER